MQAAIRIVNAAEEAITLCGINSTTHFFDDAGLEIAGRREMRRFTHLSASVEQTLTLAPDTTPLQTDAARALEEINSRKVRR